MTTRLPHRRPRSKRKKTAQSSNLRVIFGIIMGVILGMSLMYSAQTLQSIPFLNTLYSKHTPNPEAAPKSQENAIDFVFEYHDKLTQEVPVYEHEIPKPKKASAADIADNTPTARKEKKAPVNLIIQVGSFRNFKDADRMKAKLAIIGIEASIQQVFLDKNVRWHRVRITRFNTLQELANTRKRLKDNRINYFVLKSRS